ncbi:hypothetical protein KUV28_20310 [Ferrimonas balearica]|nr:hypothetical protein [Ferrimonas balearica]
MVKKLRYTNALAVLLTVAGLSAPALAGSEDVVVENAWSRASIGVNRPGAAYMTVRNTGELVTMIDYHEQREFAVPKIQRALTEDVEGAT